MEVAALSKWAEFFMISITWDGLGCIPNLWKRRFQGLPKSWADFWWRLTAEKIWPSLVYLKISAVVPES